MVSIGCHPGTITNPRPTRCTAAEHPLIPNDHPQLRRAISANAVDRKPQQIVNKSPSAYLNNYTTFDEYKNSRTFEYHYPGLYQQPAEKVFPGRLAGTRAGRFDWWQGKPSFDWYNVSSQSPGTFFRQDCPAGQHLSPSREHTRIPPANVRDVVCSPKSKSPRHLSHRPEKTPPVPRFPLSESPVVPRVPVVRGNFAKYITTPL